MILLDGTEVTDISHICIGQATQLRLSEDDLPDEIIFYTQDDESNPDPHIKYHNVTMAGTNIIDIHINNGDIHDTECTVATYRNKNLHERENYSISETTQYGPSIAADNKWCHGIVCYYTKVSYVANPELDKKVLNVRLLTTSRDTTFALMEIKIKGESRCATRLDWEFGKFITSDQDLLRLFRQPDNTILMIDYSSRSPSITIWNDRNNEENRDNKWIVLPFNWLYKIGGLV